MHDQLSASNHALLTLINLLYSPQGHPEIAREFLARLRAFVPFHSAALLPVDPSTYEILPGYSFDCTADFSQIYLDRHAASDPCLLSCECPLRLNQTASLTRLDGSRHWSAKDAATIRATFDFEYAVCALAGSHGRPVALLRLHRQADDQDFSDTEIAFINGITPHIATSMALSSSATLRSLTADAGLLVLDQRDKLIFNNAAAIDILASLEPDRILRLASSEYIWRQQDTENYRLREIPMTSRSLLSWLRQPAQPDSPGVSALRIVVLEPLQRRRAVRSRLQQSRLSRREIEVALGVMRGLSNADVAMELKIDEKTVKDHLRRIYGKIDVRSRTSMISKILGLDAELPMPPEKTTRSVLHG